MGRKSGFRGFHGGGGGRYAVRFFPKIKSQKNCPEGILPRSDTTTTGNVSKLIEVKIGLVMDIGVAK